MKVTVVHFLRKEEEDEGEEEGFSVLETLD